MKCSVLIAHADAGLRRILADAVHLCSGLKVVESCPDGFRAASALSRHTPDILLLDVSLPILSGLDVATIARKALPLTKVVFIASNGRHRYKSTAELLEADGFIEERQIHSELPTLLESLTHVPRSPVEEDGTGPEGTPRQRRFNSSVYA